MAYVEQTLQAWLDANPDYNKFAGTASGTPLIYQAKNGTPDLDAKDWKVWDWVPELPNTEGSTANADVSPTGALERIVLETVGDAPSASDIEVFLGEDTDAALDALQGFVDAYQDALAGGKTFYLAHFLGAGKKSQIYAAQVSWNGNVKGTFPDPYTSTVSITPNLGKYNKIQVITATEISG